MKLLRCKFCRGEMDIIGNERAINKKVKCTVCGFTNTDTPDKKEPEVMIIRRKSNQ